MWKIFAKDLHEVLANRRSWLALLALPLLLIWLAGDLSTRDEAMRTYIDPAPGAEPASTRLRGFFADLQGVSLVDEQRSDRPVWSFMDEAGLDIAAIWQPTARGGSSGAWFLYIQPLNTDQDRTLTTLAMLAQASVKLDRIWWVGALADDDVARSLTLQIIKRNGTPSATSAWLVPRVIAIIVSVVAFLVASGAWARERELGTLPLLAISPHVGWRAMFFGKLILPLLVGIVMLALSLIFAAALYRFGLKPGLPGTLAIQALAVLAVTFQGLMVSALVLSQFQAYLAAAAYLVALLLLTGVVFPIGEGSATVQAVARLFPLSFAMPPLSGWLTFGVLPSRFGSQVFGLAIQMLVFGLLASLAFWRLRRRF